MFLLSLISLNVVVIVLESVESIYTTYKLWFHYFEVVSVAIFSLEYLLRIWVSNENEKYQQPVIGNLRYMLSPLGLIDLLAILPFYLPVMAMDMRFMRALRMFRLFRMFKIVRYVSTLRLMEKVIGDKREELVMAVIFTFFILLFSSCIMYYIERDVNPNGFASIPDTMWWGISTLTTVGYGDVTPITPLGKFLGGIIAILGIGLFALPAGILAGGFSEEIWKRKMARHESKTMTPENINCPYCGKTL
jgi:voltage-gated potassium channel